MEDLAELVFVPSPGAGHVVSTVEIAKLLVARDSRLSISVIIIKFPSEHESNKPTAQTLSSSSESERIKFVHLPRDEPGGPAGLSHAEFLNSFFEGKKPHVRAAVERIVAGPTRLAGLVVDMFCTAMIDVADEFGVPSYVFFTSGAGFFGLVSHLQGNSDRGVDVEPGSDLSVPGFANPVPTRVLPSVLSDRTVASLFYNHIRRIRSNTKGILVNTFADLESTMIEHLSGSSSSTGFPPVYPVGPIISLDPSNSHVGLGGTDRKAEILGWLDEQPPSSVVFLCFGSMGSFGEDQVREIACGLEQSGVRFLWSLRKPPPKGKSPVPSDYSDPSEVLPEGFLDRTARVGKVVGWAPQVGVLAHPAVAGFVSHCGWNSILESLWFGVPVATWPLYAEQQVNAFEMVKEFGLAVEIRLEYRKPDLNSGTVTKGSESLVKAEEIERGIERLMEQDGEIRKRVKEMSEKSRKALLPAGSSHTSLSRFINDVI